MSLVGSARSEEPKWVSFIEVLTKYRDVADAEIADAAARRDLENGGQRTNKNKKKVHTIKNQSHIKKETIKIVSPPT